MVDFKGQLLAERVFQLITIGATLVGFVYGWAVQSFERTFECWAAGVALAIIACVPDWWFYRKNPIKWREPDYSDDEEDDSGEEGEEDEEEEEEAEEGERRGAAEEGAKKSTKKKQQQQQPQQQDDSKKKGGKAGKGKKKKKKK